MQFELNTPVRLKAGDILPIPNTRLRCRIEQIGRHSVGMEPPVDCVDLMLLETDDLLGQPADVPNETI